MEDFSLEKVIKNIKLKELCPNEKTYYELSEYLENKFNTNAEIPENISDEDFIPKWESIVKKYSNLKTNQEKEDYINEIFPRENKMKFKDVGSIKMRVYSSISGRIPIIYIENVDDFYELKTQVVNFGKPDPNIKQVGAAFVKSRLEKFIILSYKPYSNVSASELGLTDDQWKDYSMMIRKEHELAHFFTEKFLDSAKLNIHDELVADFVGIFSAVGKYHALWFLKGMGIDKYPEPQKKGRFSAYVTKLSDESREILKGITVKAAINIEKWSNTEESKNMNMREKIVFLCKNNVINLYSLY